MIFEAGLRSRGDIWLGSAVAGAGSGVLPRVSRFTHACFYDRRVIAEGSGHQIHVNSPGLVSRYVLRLVARARGG